MKINLYLSFLILSIFLTACGDEKSEIKETPSSQETAQKTTQEKPKKTPQSYHFKLSNFDNRSCLINVKNNYYDFSNVKQSIVLVNFFATWCPPCRGLLPHLNNIQERYGSKLFILGVLMHDEVSLEKLTRCTTSNKIRYFIASNQKVNQRFADFISPKLRLPKKFDLPLMVIFVNGKYYTHYEGMVPEEMIESDIKQALNKIKGS